MSEPTKEPVQGPVEEGYVLTNPEPRPSPWRGRHAENTRQTRLLCGLDCLPGQQDLFETDGPRNGAAGPQTD